MIRHFLFKVSSQLLEVMYVVQNQGNLGQVKACFQKSSAMFRELGNKRGIAECLAVEQARHQRAGRLLGSAKTLLSTLGAAWWPADRIEYERNIATIRAILDERTFAAEWTEGIAMTLE